MATVILPVLVVLALSGVERAKATKAEFDKLQGEWVCVGAEVMGKPWPVPERLAKWRLTFERDIWTRTYDGGKTTCRVRLNPTKAPKQMDLYGMEFDPRYFGPDPQRAIYKWDGDTLTICLGGSDRPSAFESQKVGRIVYVWKRAKK